MLVLQLKLPRLRRLLQSSVLTNVLGSELLCWLATFVNQQFCPISSVPIIRLWLSIRRCAIWRSRPLASPCARIASIAVRCRITSIAPTSISACKFWAPRRKCIVAIHAVLHATSVAQTGNYRRQLLLQDFDTFLNHGVGLEIPRALEFEVEAGWNGVVVEWFALLSWLFPVSVFRLWPVSKLDLAISQTIICQNKKPTILLLRPPRTKDPYVVACCEDHIRSQQQP